MDIFFGTVVRTAPISQGGELICLDWTTKTIRSRIPIFPENPDISHDPNPRGNTRGCRGIAFFDGRIICANYHTLEVFDREMNHERDITHGLMVGLHETHAASDGRIFVTATAIGAVLAFDAVTGELIDQYWPQEMPTLQEQLNLVPLDIDKQADNRQRFLLASQIRYPSHLHLNAVTLWKDNVYALFNKYGAVANLTTGELVIRDPELNHPHNLLITDDGMAVINNSYDHTVRFYELESGKCRHTVHLCDYPEIRRMRRRARFSNLTKIFSRFELIKGVIARPLFVRGLDVTKEHLFVGVSPASILCINRRTWELEDYYVYSRDVYVCVHGLKVVGRTGQRDY
ncbi:hypothetical protein ACFLU6_07415 [Acidobacteriota bacterium]